ncbi:hypothetical protein Tco_1338045 [Tanacetum coccineum]
MKLSQFKQVDHSAQLLVTIKQQIHAMVDDLLSTRIGYATQTDLQSYTTKFEKRAEEEKDRYIDIMDKSRKITVNESLENVYRGAKEHKDLYDTLVKSNQLDKDLFESYGKSYSLKRGCDDKDKDEDPPARSDQSKLAQAEEPVFEATDTEMPQNQGTDLEHTDDQPNVEAASKQDWYKKPKRPSTPDPDWNARKTIDFKPPQTWINKISQEEKPPLTFDELMSTPIDFSAYIMHNLKIGNLTQQHLVGPAFDLLKGTYKSRAELEYHFKECYKTVTDRLDWNNPEGQEYPFNLSKPLPLIEVRGRQVVPADYFINNDLDYHKGRSSSRKYTTSTTKTKAAKYDNIEGIEDMVPTLWSSVKVAYDKYIVWGVSYWGLKRQKFYGFITTRSPGMMYSPEKESLQ